MKKAGSLLICFILLVGLSGCDDGQKQSDEINNKVSGGVVATDSSNVNTDDPVYTSEFDNLKISDVVERYNRNELTYEAAVEELNQIRARANADELSELNSAQKKLNNIKSSKQAYIEAKDYYEEHLWFRVIESADGVSNDSFDYEEAQSLRREAIAQLEQQASESMNNEQHIDQAWELYNNLYESTGDQKYKKLLDEAERIWVEYTIRCAECSCEIGDYEGAIDQINNVDYNYTLNPDSESKLMAEKDKIYSFWPLELSQAELIDSSDNNHNSVDFMTHGVWEELEYKDSNGNKDHKGIWFHFSGMHAEGYREYRLDGRYNMLRGSLLLSKEAKNTDVTFVYKFYADGSLVYTSQPITGGTDPIEIEMNINGAKTIRIECSGDCDRKVVFGDWMISGFVDASFYIK